MPDTNKRYEVEDVTTGECFGNHDDYWAAVRRAGAMRRNWLYKKTFIVKEKAAHQKVRNHKLPKNAVWAE